MKKFTVINVLILVFLILSSANLYSQQKKFYVGLQGGVFFPSSDIVYGYQTILYENGSPYALGAQGFGSGGDFNLRFQYFPSNLGIHFDGGARILRRHISLALAPNGDDVEYDNTLDLFPVELGLVYRFSFEKNNVLPYYSAGICGYYGMMEIKHFVENGAQDWSAGNTFSMGIYHALGIYIAIYHDLLLNTEIKMNFASGNWELEDQNEGVDETTKFEKLNIGGTAFKFGLAFRF